MTAMAASTDASRCDVCCLLRDCPSIGPEFAKAFRARMQEEDEDE